jgi:twitching motility protein PilT
MATATEELEGWLEAVWKAGGTDLHIAAGAPPLGRVDGRLSPIEGEPVLDGPRVAVLVREFLTAIGVVMGDRDNVDFGLTWRDEARVRGNIYRERGGVAFALRLIPLAIPSLAELGLPSAVKRLVTAPSGLVVVTGPTGTGKSTTLASMIDSINRDRACHIMTIEDPVEYVHDHQLALVNQRQLGVDAESFASALKAVLREDPDVVLVGEMRDPESIQAALTIAETGHLVFTTLHTNDTSQAIDRIIDVFPADRRSQIQVQVASTLQGVLYQRLLPREGGGLVAAFEVMLATSAVRNLIREGKSRQLRNVIATSQSDGMQTLEQCLSAMVANSDITHEAAIAVSLHPTEVAKPAPTLAGRAAR